MRLVILLALALALIAPQSAALKDLNQKCSAFKCAKKGNLPVPKEDYVLTANGCGSLGLAVLGGTDFTECCNLHNACYGICGVSKKQCDKRFKKCMKKICSEIVNDDDAQEQCHNSAKVFHIGAKMVACPVYQKTQSEACDCVKSKDQAVEAEKKRLNHFLTLVDAAEAKDAEKLYAKHQDKDFSKLMLLLLEKYADKGITIDTTTNNFMDEMMKKMEEQRKNKDGGDNTNEDRVGVMMDDESEEEEAKDDLVLEAEDQGAQERDHEEL